MTAATPPSPKLIVVLQVIFLLMFQVFGTALAHAGLRAIRDRACNLEYAEHTGWIGPGGQGGSATENAVEFRGRDAVLFGAGFLAAGTLLFAWAGGLGLGLAARAAGRTVPRFLVRAVGAVSLAALLTACLALFPPWRLHTLPLYFVVAAFALAVTLPLPARWRKAALPALVFLVFAAGFTGFPAFPLFAGFFVFLFAATHVLVLWPDLAPRIEKHQRPRPPRA